MKKDLQITKLLENTKENTTWLEKEQKRLLNGNNIVTEIKQYKDNKCALFYKDYDDCPEQYKSIAEINKAETKNIVKTKNRFFFKKK